jgi:hypothetical protein
MTHNDQRAINGGGHINCGDVLRLFTSKPQPQAEDTVEIPEDVLSMDQLRAENEKLKLKLARIKAELAAQ